ncbi:MAG TPA: glycosyltransferase family A protein, partial [Candidatus Kapabacteria bacterium]|nr:glycosyltransferase family A protein [Candidatus Kapabacteria bacterium]
GQAIEYFLRQDYPNRELIILDDGTDAIGDLVPADPHIRYLRLNKKYLLGAKRNLACREAAGEIILHWDDDDWMAPYRIRYQVENLLKEQADICGLDNLFFFDPSVEKAWRYIYPNGSKPWVLAEPFAIKILLE